MRGVPTISPHQVGLARPNCSQGLLCILSTGLEVLSLVCWGPTLSLARADTEREAGWMVTGGLAQLPDPGPGRGTIIVWNSVQLRGGSGLGYYSLSRFSRYQGWRVSSCE